MAQGSIAERQNGSGETVYLIRYRPADGRQVKKTIGTSKRDAERALTAALAAVDRGELRSGGSERFADYCERWLAEHAPPSSPGRYRDYRNAIRTHLKPALGERKLSAIRPAHLRSLVSKLSDEDDLAPKTVNNILVPLRLMLGHAVEDGLIPSNRAATTAGSRQRLRLPEAHREMEYLRLDDIPGYLEGWPRATGRWQRSSSGPVFASRKRWRSNGPTSTSRTAGSRSPAR